MQNKLYTLARKSTRTTKYETIASISEQLEEKKDGYLKYRKIKRVLESINPTLPPQMPISRYDLSNHRKRAKVDTIPFPDNTSLRKSVVVKGKGMID